MTEKRKGGDRHAANTMIRITPEYAGKLRKIQRKMEDEHGVTVPFTELVRKAIDMLETHEDEK